MSERREAITVVSGMPRSGTSLMMRILGAAGVPLLVDGVRAPDADNPHGYFELERVKALPSGDSAWLAEAAGKAVKIIYRLLPYLPPALRYDVVFMDRSWAEILRSQEKMVARLGTGQPLAAPNSSRLAEAFHREVQSVRKRTQEQPGVRFLTVSHAALLTEPDAPLRELCRFLTIDSRKIADMLAVIDPTLYRSRPPEVESPAHASMPAGGNQEGARCLQPPDGAGREGEPWG